VFESSIFILSPFSLIALVIINLRMIKLPSSDLSEIRSNFQFPFIKDIGLLEFFDKITDSLVSIAWISDFIIVQFSHLSFVFGKILGQTGLMAQRGRQKDELVPNIDLK
jgi:hypothetical protein